MAKIFSDLGERKNNEFGTSAASFKPLIRERGRRKSGEGTKSAESVTTKKGHDHHEYSAKNDLQAPKKVFVSKFLNFE